MISSKHIWVLLFTCLIMTLFSFYLHIVPGTNTMINYVGENQPKDEKFIVTDGFLPWAVDYHKTLPAFKNRPVTTFFIEKFASWFSVRVSIAYVWINFLFTFCNGILIYYLAKLHLLSNYQALLSTIFFYSSFSILLAYFIPIATYDEPVQYFFILASFIALKKMLKVFFILFFTLAMIARESTLLLLPGIFLFLSDINFKTVFKEKLKLFKVVIVLSIPVFFYLTYLAFFYHYTPKIITETQEGISLRFSLYEKNFRDVENSSRTVLSFLSVFLLPSFLIFYYRQTISVQLTKNKWFKAFYFSLTLNTMVVFVAVFAEESRVFTLPFLIVFPFFGKIISKLIVFSQAFFHYLMCSKRIIILFVTTSLAWLLFELLYKLTNFNITDNLYREYNTISVLFIVLVLLYSRFSSAQNSPRQNN